MKIEKPKKENLERIPTPNLFRKIKHTINSDKGNSFHEFFQTQ